MPQVPMYCVHVWSMYKYIRSLAQRFRVHVTRLRNSSAHAYPHQTALGVWMLYYAVRWYTAIAAGIGPSRPRRSVRRLVVCTQCVLEITSTLAPMSPQGCCGCSSTVGGGKSLLPCTVACHGVEPVRYRLLCIEDIARSAGSQPYTPCSFSWTGACRERSIAFRIDG
jgi:hypothetical protein